MFNGGKRIRMMGEKFIILFFRRIALDALIPLKWNGYVF